MCRNLPGLRLHRVAPCRCPGSDNILEILLVRPACIPPGTHPNDNPGRTVGSAVPGKRQRVEVLAARRLAAERAPAGLPLIPLQVCLIRLSFNRTAQRTHRRSTPPRLQRGRHVPLGIRHSPVTASAALANLSSGRPVGVTTADTTQWICANQDTTHPPPDGPRGLKASTTLFARRNLRTRNRVCGPSPPCRGLSGSRRVSGT